MKVRLLHTTGNGKFEETSWEKPEINDYEIEVKAIMTGVCRSDIDMMNGNFGPLPLNMQGHEGLGQVTKIGNDIQNCNIGDFVATRGEPAFADYYNVRNNEFVVVPEADSKYILEPVACALNISRLVTQENLFKKSRVLIIGSGFLAKIIFADFQDTLLETTVIGNSNKDFFGKSLIQEPEGEYDIVIDLKDTNNVVFEKDILADNPMIIMGTDKKEQNIIFEKLLWKNARMFFPSPRDPRFIHRMDDALHFVKTGTIDMSTFWTKEYDRDTEWQSAFDEANKRTGNYSRGYIKWN